ncbi:hypothetical protein SAMN04488011_103209 [Palleronia pelagia]|uniref:Uncharacterized protein n=2 Tax=Palleronia pelagia TaxID=387096 RepID=A0A1H8F4N2_9RHOB|nr:hypothetical protein SAMN04488011_103209 [Palleronia pelagia]
MTMKTLLHALWDGAVRPCAPCRAETFDRLLSHFVPVNCVLLTIDDTMAQPRALSEDTNLVSGITLGDAVAEELDVDVPYGAVILIRHEAAIDDLSHAAGQAVAELAIAMVARAPLPAARRDAVLMELASLYALKAEGAAARALGLDPVSFCKGMSDLFRAHWSRAGTVRGNAPRTDAARGRPSLPASRARLSFQDLSTEIATRYAMANRSPADGDARSRIN